MASKYYQAAPVVVTLSDLEAGSIPFTTLESAFGPSSLGILVVSGLDKKFVQLRHQLLTYAGILGSLPAEALQALECPEAKYLVGWSCGKEKLSDDKIDTLKGSYYVNCAFYRSSLLDGAEGAERYPQLPEYTHANIWPSEETHKALAGFRETYTALCTLVIDVAVLVANACDTYAEAHIDGYTPGYLARIVKTSTTTKARLLYYFPPPPDASDDDLDSWCGTHVDHGCLTGLTSAMYAATATPSEGLEGPPDADAGLYIHDREGRTAKVGIPRECLAFQTGEALERITKGQFRAVPHFVRGCKPQLAKGVGRSTLAVFTQPNLWEVVDMEKGLDFAGFAKEVVDKNTNTNDSM